MADAATKPTCAKCGSSLELKAMEAIIQPGVPTMMLKTYRCPTCAAQKPPTTD